MKKSKFTEAQIVFAIKQSESGVTVAEICRKVIELLKTFSLYSNSRGGKRVTNLGLERLFPFCSLFI